MSGVGDASFHTRRLSLAKPATPRQPRTAHSTRQHTHTPLLLQRRLDRRHTEQQQVHSIIVERQGQGGALGPAEERTKKTPHPSASYAFSLAQTKADQQDARALDRSPRSGLLSCTHSISGVRTSPQQRTRPHPDICDGSAAALRARNPRARLRLRAPTQHKSSSARAQSPAFSPPSRAHRTTHAQRPRPTPDALTSSARARALTRPQHSGSRLPTPAHA